MMLSKRETVYLIICYKDREFTHDICSIFGMICGLHVLPLEYIHFYILSKRSNHCVELFAAEYFTDRTDVQCLHRWQKVLNPDLVKGPWTKEVHHLSCFSDGWLLLWLHDSSTNIVRYKYITFF